MTGAETRALMRATGILLATSVLRLAYEHRPTGGGFLEGKEDLLPELLAASESLQTVAERRRQPLAPGETLDPNDASEIELDRLPGVGPVTARAIVEAREAGTVFRSAADLAQVSGVGSATVERVTPHLRIAPRAGGTPRRGMRSELIDLNRATADELEKLPGVGPALAARILEKRDEFGAFSSVDQLLEVSGIGEVTLGRIRSLVRVGG